MVFPHKILSTRVTVFRFCHTYATQTCGICAFHPCYRQNQVPPAGFEQLLQHTGFTHDCKQGGTESGTVGEQLTEVEGIADVLSNITKSNWMKFFEFIKKQQETVTD